MLYGSRDALYLVVLATAVAGLGAAPKSQGYQFKTTNFVATAETAESAKLVAQMAEKCRKDLAIVWLGRELDPWYKPCPIRVEEGQIGAGGWTKFTFVPYKGQIEVNDWNMRVQGTLERILDSVIPHEVTHTILATHFRRPLPRWADEGASTLAEHDSERSRQVNTLNQVLRNRQSIPLRELLAMTEYPQQMQKVYTLYAQGYSLADLLVQEGGRKKFLKFLDDAHRSSWDAALKTNYTYANVNTLEERWHGWVMAGSPELENREQINLAEATPKRSKGVVYRGQSDDPFLGDEVVPDSFAQPAPRRAVAAAGNAPNLDSRADSLGKSTNPQPARTNAARNPDAARGLNNPGLEKPANAQVARGEAANSEVADGQPLRESALPDDDWDEELDLRPAVVVDALTTRRDASIEGARLAEVPTETRSDQSPAPFVRKSSSRAGSHSGRRANQLAETE